MASPTATTNNVSSSMLTDTNRQASLASNTVANGCDEVTQETEKMDNNAACSLEEAVVKARSFSLTLTQQVDQMSNYTVLVRHESDRTLSPVDTIELRNIEHRSFCLLERLRHTWAEKNEHSLTYSFIVHYLACKLWRENYDAHLLKEDVEKIKYLECCINDPHTYNTQEWRECIYKLLTVHYSKFIKTLSELDISFVCAAPKIVFSLLPALSVVSSNNEQGHSLSTQSHFLHITKNIHRQVWLVQVRFRSCYLPSNSAAKEALVDIISLLEQDRRLLEKMLGYVICLVNPRKNKSFIPYEAIQTQYALVATDQHAYDIQKACQRFIKALSDHMSIKCPLLEIIPPPHQHTRTASPVGGRSSTVAISDVVVDPDASSPSAVITNPDESSMFDVSTLVDASSSLEKITTTKKTMVFMIITALLVVVVVAASILYATSILGSVTFIICLIIALSLFISMCVFVSLKF